MATIEFKDFRLSEGDKLNPLWVRIDEHLKQKLLNLRARNDKPLDQLQTATLRGHIECLRAIIALGTVPPIDG